MKQYRADFSLNRKQIGLLFYVICVRYTKFWQAGAARIKLKYILKIVTIFPKPRGWVWTIRMVEKSKKKCPKLVLDKLTFMQRTANEYAAERRIYVKTWSAKILMGSWKSWSYYIYKCLFVVLLQSAYNITWPFLYVFTPSKEFRNPWNFCLWNLESWALESGIPLTIGIENPSSTVLESLNPVSGIQNPRLSWYLLTWGGCFVLLTLLGKSSRTVSQPRSIQTSDNWVWPRI